MFCRIPNLTSDDAILFIKVDPGKIPTLYPLPWLSTDVSIKTLPVLYTEKNYPLMRLNKPLYK